MRKRVSSFVTIGLMLLMADSASAYSVLTHEAIIDSAWNDSITPLLRRRFPRASPGDLKEAHAYAYGGAIIQDMGYYPFGAKFFSDLSHYVRTGDFVTALIRDSQDINEYAFALGALAHYAADNNGHAVAVNRSVPLLYPKLRRKYGDTVTYEDDPTAHIRIEFGFDVVQVAKGRYAPENYHDFIGFKVSKPVMLRAFKEVYGLDMGGLFTSLDLALGTYRWTVSAIIPEMTKVAWDLKKDEIVKEAPDLTKQKFLFNLSRASYEKEWGKDYKRPGVFTRALATFIRLIPKVGPFKTLAFKPPNAQAEELFMKSFDITMDKYRELLGDLQREQLRLENRDFDTGNPTRPGEYLLADRTYAKLLDHLAGHNFDGLTERLRDNMLAFFEQSRSGGSSRRARDWVKISRELARLKSAPIQKEQSEGGQ
jgi:hypothetical protein